MEIQAGINSSLAMCNEIGMPKENPESMCSIGLIGKRNGKPTDSDESQADGPDDDTDAPHCGRRILSSVLRRKKRKPNPKKDVKDAAGVPSAKRALGTWRV